MSNLNFNELAWKAPEHDGKYGYLPTDTYYEEIYDWIASLENIYVTDKKAAIVKGRKSIPDSDYDVLVAYTRSNKMISYIFIKKNEFEV